MFWKNKNNELLESLTRDVMRHGMELIRVKSHFSAVAEHSTHLGEHENELDQIADILANLSLRASQVEERLDALERGHIKAASDACTRVHALEDKCQRLFEMIQGKEDRYEGPSLVELLKDIKPIPDTDVFCDIRTDEAMEPKRKKPAKKARRKR